MNLFIYTKCILMCSRDIFIFTNCGVAPRGMTAQQREEMANPWLHTQISDGEPKHWVMDKPGGKLESKHHLCFPPVNKHGW